MIHNGLKSTTRYDSVTGKQGYELLFIENFDDADVHRYVRASFANDDDTSSDYLEMIKRIYNLADLVTRPVLLNIIVKTLPYIEKSQYESIIASDLYGVYVNFWIDRDDWRRIINKQDTHLLMQSVAEYFLANSKSSIHYTEFPQLLSKINISSRYYDDAVDSELRTCNFLKRDNIGNYSFMHKSMMEFFLAELMLSQLLSNRNIHCRWFLPLENVDKIAGFWHRLKWSSFLFRKQSNLLPKNHMMKFMK